jgi:hypothetical protein
MTMTDDDILVHIKGADMPVPEPIQREHGSDTTPVFATGAAVKAFGELDAIERFAHAAADAYELQVGKSVGAVCEDPNGERMTVALERLADRIIVSIDGDPDRVAVYLHCLKAGRVSLKAEGSA